MPRLVPRQTVASATPFPPFRSTTPPPRDSSLSAAALISADLKARHGLLVSGVGGPSHASRKRRGPRSSAGILKKLRKPAVTFRPARPPLWGDGGMRTPVEVWLDIFSYSIEGKDRPRPRIFHVRPLPPWTRQARAKAARDSFASAMFSSAAIDDDDKPEPKPWDERFWKTVEPKPLSGMVTTDGSTGAKGNEAVARFEPSLDVLYLDREFWTTRKDNSVDDYDGSLLPFKTKEEAAPVENIALDAASLKDRRECQWIMAHVREHFPGLKRLWALVTTLADRPAGIPKGDFARLEDDIQTHLLVADQRKTGVLDAAGEQAQHWKQGPVARNVDGCKGFRDQWTFDIKVLVYYRDSEKKEQREITSEDLVTVYDGLKDGLFRS